MTNDEIRSHTTAFLNQLLSSAMVKNEPGKIVWACHTAMRFATDIGAPRWLVLDMLENLRRSIKILDRNGKEVEINGL